MSQVHEAPTLVVEPPVAYTAPAGSVPFAGRRSILLAVVMCALVPAVRLIFIDGLIRPVVIDGPSMAPTLKNEHLRITCDFCKYPWDTDATTAEPAAGHWCPNCGRLNTKPERHLRFADRVRVDRWPMFWGEPARWDIVAIMAPSDDPSVTQATVKRVIGLPGESVSIDHGDIYVAGKRIERRVAQWRETAIAVHDDAFRVLLRGKPETWQSRWQPERKNTDWHQADVGHRYSPLKTYENFDRLIYRHERMQRGTHVSKTAPLDDDPYNQGARELEPVADLALCTRVQLQPNSSLELSFHDGNAWCRAVWSPNSERWNFYYGTQELVSERYTARWHLPVLIEWMRLDGHLQLVINGRLITRQEIDGEFPEDFAELPPPVDGCCAAVGAAGGAIEIKELRLLRDIHYLSPIPSSELSPDRTWFLGANEYLVLGDNPPVSVDSRQWPGGSIQREQVWGIIRGGQ